MICNIFFCENFNIFFRRAINLLNILLSIVMEENLKIMKKVLIAVALCMAFVYTTEAQERRGGFGGPGGFQARMIEMMKEKIPNLTQVQTDSISAFMTRQAEEMRKNRPEPGQISASQCPFLRKYCGKVR